MVDLIREIPDSFLDEARTFREDLHRHPELAFEEQRTAKVVVEKLRDCSIEILAEGVAGTGLVGLVRGARPGRTVALRAEMDALPIQERTGLPFASSTPGIMHACGHDGHVAILVFAARLLAAMSDDLAGNVKVIFQPGEERGAGARKMVEAGVLTAPGVDAIFALHARPQVRAGQIELSDLPSAASDVFSLRLFGEGCHAAYPHLGADPIAVGAQIVNALQHVVARQVAPFDAAVVSVGSFHAGTRHNIIPGEAELTGTIRTRDPAVREQVVASVERIVAGCASALGVRAELRLTPGSPRVYNDPALLTLVRAVGAEILGAGDVLDASETTMGSEDFAYYLEEQGGVPGCLFRLGVEAQAFVHTDVFDFGHQALEAGILMMSNVAIRYLSGDNR